MGSQRVFILCLFLTVLTPLVSGCVSQKLEGIATLSDLAKNEKIQEEALIKQNQTFQKIKSAILQKSLKPGLAAPQVSSLYGDPIAVVEEDKRSRWIYKTAESGLLSAPKIYLFFDENRYLTHWECLRRACQA